MGAKALVSFIIGTRPEAIKLCPVINVFKSSSKFQIRVILTGQHRDLVSEVLSLFNVTEDVNFSLMKHGQTLSYINSEILQKLEQDFKQHRPDLLFVQGDTTTAYSAAITAFYERVPIAHVEAGLRTDQIDSPFPEEANRRLISQIASLHFAPTISSKENLHRSNVSGEIYITGNTVVDALLYISKRFKSSLLNKFDITAKKIILASVHRRENWGQGLSNIIVGIKKILEKHKDTVLIFPMHPNKKLQSVLLNEFKDFKRVFLINPINYAEMINMISQCTLILTDSGGIQEEAPMFGKPVLVLRDSTERKEAIDAGTAKLIGTCSEKIFNEANILLTNKEAYQVMSKIDNPFGDGKSSLRILEACIKKLKI